MFLFHLVNAQLKEKLRNTCSIFQIRGKTFLLMHDWYCFTAVTVVSSHSVCSIPFYSQLSFISEYYISRCLFGHRKLKVTVLLVRSTTPPNSKVNGVWYKTLPRLIVISEPNLDSSGYPDKFCDRLVTKTSSASFSIPFNYFLTNYFNFWFYIEGAILRAVK